MATSPIGSAPPSTTAATAASQSQGGFKASADTFMTLLVANLKNQDPMQPQDSSAYMQQISQITMVQQMTELADASKASQNVGLLGKTVTYEPVGGGAAVTGPVEKVDLSGEKPLLTIAGQGGIDPKLIVSIATTA